MVRSEANSNVSALVKLVGWAWHNTMYLLGIRATVPVSLLAFIVVVAVWALWSPNSIIQLWVSIGEHAAEQTFRFQIPLPHIN